MVRYSNASEDADIERNDPVRVAVLIVAYNGREYLPDCLDSVFASDRSGVDFTVFVLDNASPDDSGTLVREQFEDCVVLRSEENLGFSSGNNYLWDSAKQRSSQWDFVYLLNQDTVVDAGFLVEAAKYLQQHPDAGAAQSLLLLHPETERINTSGNQLHFLGFGIPRDYRRLHQDTPDSGIINYPSGASVLVRADLIRENLFEAALFMYLEDAALGWRLHLIDRPPHLCASSVVYHKYTFATTMRSHYYLERNRWWLVATHYRLATLLLLSPALLAMEFGQLVFATSSGVLGSKVRAAVTFFRPSFLTSVWRTRKSISRQRVVGDHVVLGRWTGVIDSPHLTNWTLRRVANPMFNLWLRLIRAIVIW